MSRLEGEDTAMASVFLGLLAAVANRAENGVAHSSLVVLNWNARPTNYVVSTHSDESALLHHCDHFSLRDTEGRKRTDTHKRAHTPAHSPINKAHLVSAAHCPVRPNKEPSFPLSDARAYTHTRKQTNTDMYTDSCTIRKITCGQWGELLNTQTKTHTHTKCWAITLVERDSAWYTCDTTITQSCTHNALKWQRQSQIPGDWGLFVCGFFIKKERRRERDRKTGCSFVLSCFVICITKKIIKITGFYSAGWYLCGRNYYNMLKMQIYQMSYKKKMSEFDHFVCFSSEWSSRQINGIHSNLIKNKS